MPERIEITWENAPETTWEETETLVDNISKAFEPLGYEFRLLGYDSDGRYDIMTGFRE